MVEQLCNTHLTLDFIPTTVRRGESTLNPEFTSTFMLDFWTGTMKKLISLSCDIIQQIMAVFAD